MRHSPEFDAAMARCPLVAILRGIRPDEIEAIADMLVDVGFTMIEVFPAEAATPAVLRAQRGAAGRTVGAGRRWHHA